MEIYALKNDSRYMFNLLLEEIIEIKNIDFFDPTDANSVGYQRKIEPIHLRNLRSFIRDLNGNVSFPTPIILGALTTQLTIVENINTDVGNLVKIILPQGQLVNIVDGQHRLEALVSLVAEFPELLKLNIMCILSLSDTRLEEIETFIDINSKAKKIKPDLAMLALNRHKILSEAITTDNLAKYIGIKVSYLMNNDRKSVWHNAIKFNFNEDEVEGIASVSSFVNSLESYVKLYIKNNNTIDMTILEADEIAEELKKMVNECWQIVKNKWPDCFHISSLDEIEKESIYYDRKFEIQLYSGFWAINTLIKNTYKYSIDNNIALIGAFKSLIERSKLNSSDWRRGGLITGRTSQAAIKKSLKDILSEEDQRNLDLM